MYDQSHQNHDCQTIHMQVAAAPLHPCPLLAAVLLSLRKIHEGSLLLLSRQVDLETVERTVRSQALDKVPLTEMALSSM